MGGGASVRAAAAVRRAPPVAADCIGSTSPQPNTPVLASATARLTAGFWASSRDRRAVPGAWDGVLAWARAKRRAGTARRPTPRAPRLSPLPSPAAPSCLLIAPATASRYGARAAIAGGPRSGVRRAGWCRGLGGAGGRQEFQQVPLDVCGWETRRAAAARARRRPRRGRRPRCQPAARPGGRGWVERGLVVGGLAPGSRQAGGRPGSGVGSHPCCPLGLTGAGRKDVAGPTAWRGRRPGRRAPHCHLPHPPQPLPSPPTATRPAAAATRSTRRRPRPGAY